MSRVKGTANLSASLEVLAGAPLDSRTIVPTESDLTDATNFQYKYVGMPVVVQETGIMYILLDLDVTDADNWKKVGSDVDIKNSAFDLIGTSSTLEGSISTTQDVIDKYDFLVIKVNIIDNNNVETDRGTQLLCPCSQLASADAINIVNGGNSVNELSSPNVTYLFAYLNNTGLTYWYAKFNGSQTISSPKYICRLYGLKLSGTGIDYSTSEKAVGTWVDGTTIYQRTIDCGALPNATTKYVSTDIDASQIVKIEGFATTDPVGDDKAITIPLPFAGSGGSFVGVYAHILDTNKISIRISADADRTAYNGFVTVQYIKPSN